MTSVDSSRVAFMFALPLNYVGTRPYGGSKLTSHTPQFLRSPSGMSRRSAVELEKVEGVQHSLADGAAAVERVEDRDVAWPTANELRDRPRLGRAAPRDVVENRSTLVDVRAGCDRLPLAVDGSR
jgi:hypothetical protein